MGNAVYVVKLAIDAPRPTLFHPGLFEVCHDYNYGVFLIEI